MSDFELYRSHATGTLGTQAYQSGDSRLGMLDYGPAVVFADGIKPVDAIFDEILDDAQLPLGRLGRLQLI